MSLLEKAIAGGFLPDALVRIALGRQLRGRLNRLDRSAALGYQQDWIEQLRQSPLAALTAANSTQQDQIPPEFFCLVLGRHMKYSCCNWAVQNADLDEAEEAMLRLTIQRAELADGQEILELGCGWGSLSLTMARQFPGASITAVSDSSTQKNWIDKAAQAEGIENLRVITADIQAFEPDKHFDRVVSVETFERLRNYEKLFEKIAEWLKPGGKMFAHIFCHREYSYPLDSDFFDGGMMPSENIFRYFGKDLSVAKAWKVSGLHYHRTCEAWLRRMDRHREAILEIFSQTYGADQAAKQLQSWRVFLMARSELFKFNQGEEWYVSHTLFERKAAEKIYIGATGGDAAAEA